MVTLVQLVSTPSAMTHAAEMANVSMINASASLDGVVTSVLLVRSLFFLFFSFHVSSSFSLLDAY
jgi:hypothetical protein